MRYFFFSTFFLICNVVSAFDYVSESVANMHATNDEMSELVSQAIYGTPIKIIEQDGQWTKIETPDSYQGWCKADNLISKSAPYPSTPVVAKVNSIWTHIHIVPDTTPHPPVLTLPYSTNLEVLSSPEELNQRWIQVHLLDGSIYWAHSEDFLFNPDPISLDEMIEEAKKFLGLPYLWGGNSSFGFDCSGFVQILFSQMDIHLPRDASQQAHAKNVTIVSIDRLQKGDLLFFGKSSHRITHVGIYLGQNEFIHSVTTNLKGLRAIQISSLDDPEWKETVICARRVNVNRLNIPPENPTVIIKEGDFTGKTNRGQIMEYRMPSSPGRSCLYPSFPLEIEG